MTTSTQGRSATIYQFPARGRFAANVALNEFTEAERLPKVVYGSGWYHDEAIEEAQRARKQAPVV